MNEIDQLTEQLRKMGGTRAPVSKSKKVNAKLEALDKKIDKAKVDVTKRQAALEEANMRLKLLRVQRQKLHGQLEKAEKKILGIAAKSKSGRRR